MEYGFKERLTTCASDLEKALPMISPLKRQRPREWNIYTNQEEADEKHQAVVIRDYSDYQLKPPFWDSGYSPDTGGREDQSTENSGNRHGDNRRRPRGGVIVNRQRETHFCRLAPFSRRCIQKRRRAEGSMLVTPVPPTKEQLQETWKMIDHWQEQMSNILAEDWEYKRTNWIDQCHNVLWNVQEDSTLIEKPTSEMFPKTLLPITLLNKMDKH